VTEALAETVLSLPLYPELGESGVERVCEALLAAIDSEASLEPRRRAEARS
jgi:dTDP-4-amino-4,6-dideoxygalactose transaminase